jgi:hypothetical protein
VAGELLRCEVARRLGISPTPISRLKAVALRELRRALVTVVELPGREVGWRHGPPRQCRPATALSA